MKPSLRFLAKALSRKQLLDLLKFLHTASYGTDTYLLGNTELVRVSLGTRREIPPGRSCLPIRIFIFSHNEGSQTLAGLWLVIMTFL
jgi:hypothetical protein